MNATGTAGDRDRTWRVGELADETGLTVRALHHYDEIGLLVPSSRSDAGHRRYTGADVQRLHRIRALRGFGLSLAEVGAVLDEPGLDAGGLLRRQLDQVDERIAAAYRLRHGLERVLGALDRNGEPSARTLVELIEVMTVVEKVLTPQQVEEMAAHRRRLYDQLTPEQLAELVEGRRRMTAGLTPDQLMEMRARRAAAMPPGSPRADGP